MDHHDQRKRLRDGTVNIPASADWLTDDEHGPTLSQPFDPRLQKAPSDHCFLRASRPTAEGTSHSI